MLTADDHARRLSALRSGLRMARMHMALDALEFARQFHVGLRKDGAPEISHQVAIAFHIIDLPDLIEPEETIAVGLLHDTPEDYGEHLLEAIRQRFGDGVHAGVRSVSKKLPVYVEGRKVHVLEIDEDELYANMANDVRGSIVKGVDRGHNQKTMGGVFTREKQLSYVDFTDERIIPMMKRARKIHQRQYRAYMLLQDKLESQAALVRSWAEAA